jgi:hypothetical protein
VVYGYIVGVVLLLREVGEGAVTADARVTRYGVASLTAAALLEEHTRRSSLSPARRCLQVLEAFRWALFRRV